MSDGSDADAHHPHARHAPTECDSDCEDALRQLGAFLDGELPGADVDDIRRHLTACYPCTERASFEEQLRAIVRRDCTDHAPPSLFVRIEAALQEGLPDR